jgi:protein ImuB
LAVEWRERPEPSGWPIAIFDPNERSNALVECPPELEALGMCPGMPLKEAETRWPETTYRPDDPECYERAMGPIIEILEAYSPTVECWVQRPTSNVQRPMHPVDVSRWTLDLGPWTPVDLGLVFLDGTGLEPLYGPEEWLGARIVRDLAELAGFGARVGIAGGRFSARLAAMIPREPGAAADEVFNRWTLHTTHRVVRAEREQPLSAGASASDGRSAHVAVVPPGEDAAFLAPLSIVHLPIAVEARARLARLGVRTMADFARLPPNALRHRLGTDGPALRAMAMGGAEPPLRGRPTSLVVRDQIEFDWIEESRDRLTFALKGLADRLSARLAVHGLGCGQLQVGWRLEDGSTLEARVVLAERSVGGGRLLEHLRWHVEGLTLRHGVCGIDIEARELAPLDGRQLALLPGDDGRMPNAERQLAARDVATRLRARWGDEAVQQAELVDSRRTEAAFRWLAPRLDPGVSTTPKRRQPSAKRSTANQPPPPAAHPQPSLRLWADPQQIDIIRPASREHGRRALLKRDDRAHPIAEVAGPWRLVEPWGEQPLARDMYQVVTVDGGASLVAHDRPTGTWQLLGEFD